MTTTHGSMFSGYGGLDRAIEAYYGATTLWHVEFDPAASRVLEANTPDIPNLGDITNIDWLVIPFTRIHSGGSPCQDLSLSGPRSGMVEGTRSGLWLSMLTAITVQRPEVVVWENVKGALSAPTHRDDLKALGLVLGDLHDAGYDAKWVTVGADEVGAPHRRDRVFVLAVPSKQDSDFEPNAVPWVDGAWQGLVKMPPCGIMTRQGITKTWSRTKRDISPLPTPAASDWRSNNYPADLRRNSPRITAHGAYFPRTDLVEFGGRQAPEPTFINARGKEELDPKFVEWMMGLPEGHVTDVPLTRKEVHTILGNGVVPQQAYYALELLNDPNFGPTA